MVKSKKKLLKKTNLSNKNSFKACLLRKLNFFNIFSLKIFEDKIFTLRFNLFTLM